MKIDTSSCWYDNVSVPEEMIKGATGKLWPTLEHSDHFPVLKQIVDSLPEDVLSMVEVGCGSGSFQRIFDRFYCVGIDLPHIIDKVAKQVYPQGKYLKLDIYRDAFEEIREFDCVLMNAFIDVMEHPLFVLEKILQNANRYIILHRQAFCSNKEPTQVTKEKSYGGWTYHSLLNWDEFFSLLKKYNFGCFSTHRIVNYPGDVNSFLIGRC
jgi:SAM-dependent methyltransferase